MAGHVYFEHWNSLADLLRATTKSQTEHRIWSCNSKFVGRSLRCWTDVCHAAEAPWPEGVRIVEQMVPEIQTSLPSPVSRKRRPRYNEMQGDEACPDRMRSGEPYWRTTKREVTSGPQTVTLLVNVAGSCKIKPSDIFWRGAAALALTNKLEDAGYDVEIIVTCKGKDVYGRKSPKKGKVARGTGDGFLHAVTIKHPGVPADEVSLANALSGWFFRTVWFQSMGIRRPEEIDARLGYPAWLSETGEHELKLAGNGKLVLIDLVFTRQAAVNLAEKTLLGFQH